MLQLDQQKVNLLGLDSFKINRLAVFDIETTGLDPKKDDILDISIIDCSAPNNSFQSLAKTDIKILPDITAINGITNADVQHSPDINSVLNKVYNQFHGYTLVAHNAHKFDSLFFLAKSELLFYEFNFLDTLPLAKYVLPGLECTKGSSSNVNGYSMKSLVTLFGVDHRNAHTSMGDTSALLHVFKKLTSLLDDVSKLDIFIRTGKSLIKNKK